jgi:hypothetical protein
MGKQRRNQKDSDPGQLTQEQVHITNFIVKQISSKPFFSSRVAKEMWAMKKATVVIKEIKAEMIDWLQDEITKCLQGETEWSQHQSATSSTNNLITSTIPMPASNMTWEATGATPWNAGGRSVGMNSTLKFEKASTNMSDNVFTRNVKKVWFISTHLNLPPKSSLT